MYFNVVWIRTISFYIAASFVLFCVSGSAEAGLHQRGPILQKILQNNRVLRITRSRLRRARARYKGAKVFPNNPVLSASGGVQVGQNTPTVGPRVSTGLSLDVPIGGRWGQRQKLAQVQIQYIQNMIRWQSFALSLRTHQALNNIALSAHTYKIQQSLVRLFTQLETFTRKRVQHGSATQLDIQIAQAGGLQAQQAAIKARLQSQLLKQRLQTLAGTHATMTVSEQLPDLPTIPSEKELQNRAKVVHPRIRLARLQLQQNQTRLALSKSQAIPDLTFSVGYALEDNNHVITGGLAIPLPLFWRNQSAIGQSRAQIRTARITLAQIQFNVRRTIHTAYLQYQTSKKVAQLAHKRLRLSQRQSLLLQKGLQQGSLSLLKALTAQRSIRMSQLLYIQSLQTAHKHYIALCKASGMKPSYTAFLKL